MKAQQIIKYYQNKHLNVFYQFIPKESMEEQWDIAGLEKQIQHDFNLSLPIQSWLKTNEQLHEETLKEKILTAFVEAYEKKEVEIGAEQLRTAEKGIMLQVLDSHWKDHLSAMDQLRQGIQLRGYAQKNPTQEFKRESFTMFTQLLDNIKYAFIATLSKIQVATPDMMSSMQIDMQAPQLHFTHEEFEPLAVDGQPNGEAHEIEKEEPFVRQGPKVGRNDPCHCGSGKKFKQCHGRL